jgi:prevent-host-death family protein
MATKSDIHLERTVSATEASRNFSELLDEVEAGATVHIVRRGREVCVMASSPPETRRRKLSEIIAALKDAPKVYLDNEFGKDMEAVIEAPPMA